MAFRTLRRASAASVIALYLLAVSGCGTTDPPENSGQPDVDAQQECQDLAAQVEDGEDSADDRNDAGGETADTFIFGSSASPITLNPLHASDSDSFRVAHQIFETLVEAEPCGPGPSPLLATDWTSSDDGKTFDFTLRDDVTFHDGTEFDADVVCWNFEHWNNQPEGMAQSADITYHWSTLFKGFGDDSIYESCTTSGDSEVTIELNEPFASFVNALAIPAFSMQSPEALEKWGQIEDGGDPTATEYATAHPTGTGPYQFSSWNRGTSVNLTAFDDYWDGPPKTPHVTIKTIEDPQARADALRTGDVDAFDLVAPGDVPGLRDEDFTLIHRPSYNIQYLGMNQAAPPLDDLRVRQAIAHAIDREQLMKSTMTPGSEAANQFVPPVTNGYSDDVTEYEYDPEKARQLLEESGYEDLTIEFNYPTDVSRPYLPSPQDTFNQIRNDLQSVGITVVPVADQWSVYLSKIHGGEDHGIHVLGWTGEYNDADSFLGAKFSEETPEFGFTDQEVFDQLAEARGLPTPEEQEPAYQEANEMIMDRLPGLPLGHGVPVLALAPRVSGYVPSPVEDESWDTVTVREE
ncbi:ABC transporter substrate-binding protein [Brevibacterium yomogidense]|uniref:ABC transporter substrate-binding protein n=1 Tax=Brevibacterium yomogidense TaxID=946573 RepID=UPI0018DFB3CC